MCPVTGACTYVQINRGEIIYHANAKISSNFFSEYSLDIRPCPD